MVGGALAGGVLVLVTALARAAVGRAAAVAALEPPATMAVCLVEWTVDRAGAVLAGAVLAGAVAAALVGGVVFVVAVAAAVVAACMAGVAVVVATGWAGAAGAAAAGVCTRGGSARLWRDAPLGARAVGAAPVGALVATAVAIVFTVILPRL